MRADFSRDLLIFFVSSNPLIDFKKGITPKNPLLKNGDVVRVRRNALAKSSDALKSISDPLQGVVTIYSLFKIID